MQGTIHEGYAQDKIDFLDNTLPLTPGVTLQARNTSLRGSKVLGGTPPDADAWSDYGETFGCSLGAYKIHE